MHFFASNSAFSRRLPVEVTGNSSSLTFLLVVFILTCFSCKSGIEAVGGSNARCAGNSAETTKSNMDCPAADGATDASTIIVITSQLPPATNNYGEFMLAVDSGKISAYRYKVVAGDFSLCKNADGYSEVLSSNTKTNIDLTVFAEGQITLCIIGQTPDGIWTHPTRAAKVSWEKITTPPGDFTIISPTSTSTDEHPLIKWSRAERAKVYELVLSGNPDCSAPLVTHQVPADDQIAELSFQITDNLPETVKFFICLSAKDKAGNVKHASNSGIPTVRYEPIVAATSVTTTVSNGAYTIGAAIPISVTFSRPVVVTGIPTLQLETGASDRQAVYVSGSGGTSLLFSYSVEAGDTASPLDYGSPIAISLNGGSILDAAGGYPASVSLPLPGASGSLSASHQLVIDTIAPVPPANMNLTPGRSKMSLSWTTSDPDVAGFVVVHKKRGAVTWVPQRGMTYPPATSPVSGEWIDHVGPATAIDVLNLAINEPHHFAVFAYDAARNYSVALSGSDRPSTGNIWIADGKVIALEKHNNELIVGGDFRLFGPRLGGGLALDPTSGANNCSSLAEINGEVLASATTSDGGWVVGGKFTKVGGVTRKYLARLKADCSLHPLSVTIDDFVNSVAVIGENLWIGGPFKYVNDTLSPSLAALDVDTGGTSLSLPSHPSNYVNSFETDGTNLYVAGGFTHFGTYAGSGVKINSAGVLSCTNAAPIIGAVRDVVPDGSGGWYIGGSFTQIGQVERKGIARLNADCSLHSWYPGPVAGLIYSLTLDNGVLYVGGAISSVNGVTRTNFAAIDVSTGNVLPLNLAPNAAVNDSVVDGTTLYLVGGFTNIGGQNRNRVAALNISTGLITTWAPSVNNNVRVVAVDGSSVYIGGDFNSAGGSTRSRLASLNRSDNFATTWNPNVNSSVHALVLSGTDVYIGGAFTTAGGSSRNRLAKYSTASNTPTAWDPNANNVVYSLRLQGSTLFVGGGFSTVGGSSRIRLAAVDNVSGAVNTWNPQTDSNVYALADAGADIFVGGNQKVYGGAERGGGVALDGLTGNVLPWNPAADSDIYSIAVSPNAIYVGGQFDNLSSIAHPYFGATNKTTGAALAWDPGSDDQVTVLHYADGKLYAAGDFGWMDGEIRGGLAAFDESTGAILPWYPSLSGGYVLSFATTSDTLLLGGTFNSVGGQPRHRLAAFDLANGSLKDWSPCSLGMVRTITVGSENMYVGSGAMSAGCIERVALAKLNTLSGEPTNWDPALDGAVESLALAGDILFVGGSFANGGGQSRQRAAAYDLSTGLLTPWNPSPNNVVYALATYGSDVYVGGSFTSIGGQSRNRLAVVDATTGGAGTWDPNLNNIVYALTRNGSDLFVGGSFSTASGSTRNRLASWDLANLNLNSWDPNAGSMVRSLKVNGPDVIVGGTFSSMGAQARKGVAVVSATGAGALQPLTADTSTGAFVYAFAPAGSSLLIGGTFIDIAGTPRQRLASVNMSTSALDPLSLAFSNTVFSLYLDGTDLWVGGLFTASGDDSSPPSYLAKINLLTGHAQ